jgi:hypothetical protein
MTRLEFMEKTNKLIKEERGNSIQETGAFISSGIDSLSMTIVIGELSDRYNVYTKEEFEKLDFANITPKDMMDKICLS